MKDLYVVNTPIAPVFLDIELIVDLPRTIPMKHDEFVLKVREQYSKFGTPYFALFKDGKFIIPDCNVCGGMKRGGVGGLEKEGISLEGYIEGFLNGKDVFWDSEVIPITSIVEFSPSEIYLEAIEALSKKYEIKRVFVD